MDTNKKSVEKKAEASLEDKFKSSSSPSAKVKKVVSPSKDQIKVSSPSESKKVRSPSKAKLQSPLKLSSESISEIPSQQSATDTVIRVSSRISERKKALNKSHDSETTTTSKSVELSPKLKEKENIAVDNIEHILPQNTTDVPTRLSLRISERKKRALDKSFESEATNFITSEETNSKQNEEAANKDIASKDIEKTPHQPITDIPIRVSSRISERKKRALDKSCESPAETSSAREEKNPKQKKQAVEKDIVTQNDESSSEHEDVTLEDEDSGTESQADEPRHKVNIEIGDKLKKVLELDYDLINNKNKLIALPGKPTVISILESWVLDYTTTLIKKITHKRHKNSEAQDIIDETISNINLCREIADGIRVYFDHTLAGLLLYGVERDQYNSMMLKAKAVSVPLVLEESITINNKTNGSNMTVEKELRVEHKSSPSKKSYEGKENETEIEKTSTKISTRRTLRSSCLVNTEEPMTSKSVQESKQEIKEVSSLTDTKYESPQEEPKTCEPIEERKQETENLSSSASTSSRGSSSLALTLRSSTSLINSDLVNELTEKAKVWRLVKDDKIKSSMPSNIYDATHLVRLFVRLPDLLGRSELTKGKLKLVLKYIYMFLSYMESHEEWFGEQFYI